MSEGENNDSSSNTVKTTNVEVCVRIRPLLGAPSTPSYDSPSPARRTSRLPPRNKAPTTPKTPQTPATPVATPEIETIMAWDVIGNDSIQQSAKTDRIQGRTHTYTLDQVYGPVQTTEDLYLQSVQPVVLSSLQGYHASVFAYGQTSTGKTYTMTGTPSCPGIVPLAVHDLFDSILHTTDTDAREYLMRVSYLEIYNEQIIDLLTPTSSPRTAIRIMESKEGVVVRGLREEIVTSPEDIFVHLKAGNHRRQTGSTNMNKHSSRSHAIVRIWMESKSTTSSCSRSGNGMTRVSSLSLVDLAGSESVRLTGSTGERRREGQYINKSLMTLGQVIYKLAAATTTDASAAKGHIPYRDSKLTRLLQPSLSGNAQIVCICNISPSVSHLEESHNTLKFAIRAKRIQQRVVLNQVSDQNTLLQAYKEEIEELKQQLAEARAAAAATTTATQDQQQQQQPDQEDTRELLQAIKTMEALILKTQRLQQEQEELHGAAVMEDDEDDLLSPNSAGSAGELLLSPEFHQAPAHTKNNGGDKDSLLTVDTTSSSLVDEDPAVITTPHVETAAAATTTLEAEQQQQHQPLLDEMERIQGLLDSVLTKQGRRGGANGAAYREEEVQGLRSQLEELEVATSLKKADASFLQSQLREKDMLLAEVAKILEVIEQRQLELEAENSALQRMVIDKNRQLAFKEKRIAEKERQLSKLKARVTM